MRTRITAAVALLVAGALVGVGLIVYTIESQRVDRQVVREIDQEFIEFNQLLDPDTGADFTSVESLIELFLSRNVPDDDEGLIGWVGDRPTLQSPAVGLAEDADFVATVAPIVSTGGSLRTQTRFGDTVVTAQPIVRGEETGALIVVKYVDRDRDELLDTMRTFGLVAVSLWMLVVLLAAWTSGRLLAPLRVLRDTAEGIGDGDLSQRIPETGNDDITAMTRTVNRMLDRLETAFGDQRRFLDDAGHELKTPLTVLRGHLELLDVDNPQEVADTRALLLDETDRMARLVGDLILLAKSDRPDFVSTRPIDVAAMTVDVLAKARALGDRTWDLDGTAAVTAAIDEQRLTQALLQLCDNAVKHTSPGDVVAVGSSYGGIDSGELRLWVRDTGVGVPAEDHHRIFERFGRSNVPDGDEGFGLGLSIVAAIASAHGGRVHVEDADPTGARFVITLSPALDEPPVEVLDDSFDGADHHDPLLRPRHLGDTAEFAPVRGRRRHPGPARSDQIPSDQTPSDQTQPLRSSSASTTAPRTVEESSWPAS